MFSEAAQVTMGTGDAHELARIARDRRLEQTKEAHSKAVALVPTLEEWWREAPSEVRTALGADIQRVKDFVTANKELVDNPQELQKVMHLTKVFHTFKQHADKQINAVRAEAETAVKTVQEKEKALQEERNQHAKTTAQLNSLRRRIALLEGSVPNAGAAGGQANAPPAMRSGGFSQQGGPGFDNPGQLLHSMASKTTPAAQKPVNGTKEEPMSSLLANNLGQPGEKRTASQAQLDIKHTQASATATTSGFERKTRPRLKYDTDIPYRGCFGHQNSKDPRARPLPGIFDQLMSGVKTELQQKGLSASLLRGVEIDRLGRQ